LALTFGLAADIEGAPLSDELISFESFVKKLKNPTALNTLNFMKIFDMETQYPNIWVPLRILLMPVSVGSGEGRFSTPKLIKTYLRT
jgi:hypothetical protein